MFKKNEAKSLIDLMIFLFLLQSSLLQDTSDDKGLHEQLATIPFLLHIASLSPEMLKGTLSDFVESRK